MNQKSLIVILVAFIIILIGTTVYFVTINKISQPVLPEQKVVQESASTPIIRPTDEIASWQVYENDKYGFEFKYPNYLKPESTNDSPFAIFIVSLSNRKNDVGNLKNGDIVLSIKIAKKAMSLAELLNQMKDIEKNSGVTISRYKETKVGGFSAIQQLEDVKVDDIGCYWSTYIKKGDRYDQITLMSTKCDIITNIENDYNKILSTFKFIK